MLVLRCYFEIPPAMEDASSYRPDRLSSRSRPINTLNGTRGVISGVRRRSSRRHDSGIRAARVDHSRVHHCQVESESLAIIAAGAIGSVIGRYILTLYLPRVSGRLFRRWETENLSFLGKKLGGRFWQANTFVMLYAISPLSTTALFTAAGMAHVNPWHILPGFAVGKFLGDAWVLFTVKRPQKKPPICCRARCLGKRA
jgi:hypothetical protein